MPTPSFRKWLGNRDREAPVAELLPMLVARSGAGMSRDDIARALRLPPETLDDLLRALAATRQVTMLKIGGRTACRAAG
jgi:DNA-binding IclR family transcriptional regulator